MGLRVDTRTGTAGTKGGSGAVLDAVPVSRSASSGRNSAPPSDRVRRTRPTPSAKYSRWANLLVPATVARSPRVSRTIVPAYPVPPIATSACPRTSTMPLGPQGEAQVIPDESGNGMIGTGGSTRPRPRLPSSCSRWMPRSVTRTTSSVRLG